MGFEGKVWRLMQQEELLGEIVIDEADFPWLNPSRTPDLAPLVAIVCPALQRNRPPVARLLAADPWVRPQRAMTRFLADPGGPWF